MPTLVRMEHRFTRQSLWYTPEGDFDPIVLKLKDGSIAKELPMGFDPDMRAGGDRWISACQTLEALACVFTPEDVCELESQGYGLFEFTVENFRSNSWHDMFRRKDVTNVRELPTLMLKSALLKSETGVY